MSYKKAVHFLPTEIIELIQEYIEGESIYIPKKANKRKKWGESTTIRQELFERNQLIFSDYQKGLSTKELAHSYCLSQKSIQRIILQIKKTA